MHREIHLIVSVVVGLSGCDASSSGVALDPDAGAQALKERADASLPPPGTPSATSTSPITTATA